MRLSKRLENLGTESAFAVSAAAAAIGPEETIGYINKLNANDESCSNHFIQKAMAETTEGDTDGPAEIIRALRERRDAAVAGLEAIEGISAVSPDCTFYLFPNVTAVMKRKGYSDVNQLMTKALEQCNVSFCTPKHFGKPMPGEEEHYIRLAYSGISVDDIEEGMAALKEYFER